MKNQFKVFSPQKRRKFYPTDLELILHKVKNRTKVLILKSIVLRTNTQVVEQEFKVNFHLYLLPKSIRVQSNFQDGFKKKIRFATNLLLCHGRKMANIGLPFPSNPESLECPLFVTVCTYVDHMLSTYIFGVVCYYLYCINILPTITYAAYTLFRKKKHTSLESRV